MIENKEKNKKDYGKVFRGLATSCRGGCDFLQKNNWFLTILFFFAVFAASIWVWYGSILDVQPSPQVVDEFQAKQREIASEIESIERTIEKMQERQARFNNPLEFNQQRDIFENKEKELAPAGINRVDRAVQ